MKGEFIHAVLDIVSEAIDDGMDINDAIQQLNRLNPSLWKPKARAQRQYEREQRRKLQKLIYQLKQDNLIDQRELENRTLYKITTRGIEKLKILKKILTHGSLPSTAYAQEKATTFTIVTFDIPEKERRKRHWLRSVLKNLGLQLLQKSVWFGKIKIPQEFIEDMHKLDIIHHVEILEIRKKGTLKSKY